MMETKKLSGWINALMASLLVFIPTYFASDIFGGFFYFLFFPLLVLWLGEEKKFSFLAYLILAVLGGLFLGVDFLLFMLPTLILIAIVVGEMIKRNSSVAKEWLLASFVLFFLLFLQIFLLEKILGQPVYQDIVKQFDLAFTDAAEALQDRFVLDGGSKPAFDFAFAKSREFILQAIPSIFFLASSFIMLINLYLSRLILSKTKEGFELFRFGNIKITRQIFYLFVLSFILFKMASGLGFDFAHTFSPNLLVIILYLLAMDGLASIDFRLREKIPLFFRLLMIFFAFPISFLWILFILFGFFDVLFDFRKLEQRKEGADG